MERAAWWRRSRASTATRACSRASVSCWGGCATDAPGTTPGFVVPIRDPGTLLPALDAYEGPDYVRIRVVAGGVVCWSYAWRAGQERLVALPEGWPRSPGERVS